MPTKQDIDAGIAVNLAGTVPGGHGLAPIRRSLLDEPRERQWVIGQVVSGSTSIKHPPEDDDKFTPTMQFVEITAITDDADCDQLAAMAARARRDMPGQRTLDEVMDEGEAVTGRHLQRVEDLAVEHPGDDETESGEPPQVSFLPGANG